MITDKVGGSSAKPEVSKQSKEKRLKHKVSGYKSQSKRRSIAGCRLLLRTLNITLGLNPLRTSYDLQVIGKITHSTRDLTFQEKKNIVEEHAEYFNCDTV